MTWYSFTCPRCKCILSVHDEQHNGKSLINCIVKEGGCGWSGYRTNSIKQTRLTPRRKR